MAGKVVRLTGGVGEDSHLEVFDVALTAPELPRADGDLALRVQEFPAGSVRIVELPKQGARTLFHPAPRRQFVFVLQGELVVTASDGTSHRFEPGDWLFADDVASKGHHVEDVGVANFVTVQVVIPDDWEWPSTLPQ